MTAKAVFLLNIGIKMLNLRGMERICIIGGGTAGWFSALHLREIFSPSVEIILISLIYAELSGDFPLGDSRQPTYKSLRPFDLVS